MKIEIELQENKGRVWNDRRIYINHILGNFVIDNIDIIRAVRKKLDSQLLLQRLAEENKVDVSQFYENMPRAKVTRID